MECLKANLSLSSKGIFDNSKRRGIKNRPSESFLLILAKTVFRYSKEYS